MLRTFKKAFQINWPRKSKRQLTTYESNSAFTPVDRHINDWRACGLYQWAATPKSRASANDQNRCELLSQSSTSIIEPT